MLASLGGELSLSLWRRSFGMHNYWNFFLFGDSLADVRISVDGPV